MVGLSNDTILFSADQHHRRWSSSKLYTQLRDEVRILPLLLQGYKPKREYITFEVQHYAVFVSHLPFVLFTPAFHKLTCVSIGPDKWCGCVGHSDYFRQGLNSSRLLLYHRAPWAEWAHTHAHIHRFYPDFIDCIMLTDVLFICVFRSHSFKEKTRVCTRCSSGQRGHRCVGYQTDGQKQNDAAALHIRRVGSIHL